MVGRSLVRSTHSSPDARHRTSSSAMAVARVVLAIVVVTSVITRLAFGSDVRSAFESEWIRHRHHHHSRDDRVQTVAFEFMIAMAKAISRTMAFASTRELIAGAYAIGRFGRALEITIGARKFIGASAACACVFALARALGARSAFGPHELAHAMMAMYVCESAWGRNIDIDRVTCALASAALASSQGAASVASALNGWFAGLVVAVGVGSASDVFVVPSWVARALGGEAKTIVRTRAAAGGTSRTDATRGESVEPSEENVRALTSMGFGEEASRHALRRCGDDVQRATHALLAN